MSSCVECVGRRNGFDVVRGLAAFGIVACHLMLFPSAPFCRALVEFCDVSVSIFSVLSGFLMVDSLLKYPKQVFVTRRVARIVPSYLFWTLIFLFSSLAFKLIGHASLHQYCQLAFWFGVMFQGNASCHLWFLIALLYAQIIFCVIPWNIVKRMWFLAPVSAITIYFACTHTSWYCFYFARLLGCLSLGLILRLTEATWSKISLRWSLMPLAASIVIYFTTRGFVPRFVLDAIVALTVVMSGALLPAFTGKFQKIVVALSNTSMGVYLVHPLLAVAGGLLIRRFFSSPYGMIALLVDWVACWLLAFAFTWIALRVPVLKRVVR